MFVLKIIINDAAHYCVVLSGGALIIAVGTIMCFHHFYNCKRSVHLAGIKAVNNMCMSSIACLK